MSFYSSIITSLLSYFLLFSIFITSFGCSSDEILVYQSETLEVVQLNTDTYIHRSFLQTESFGKVACNGLVYFNGDEAVVMDTPPDIETSSELIEWIENNQAHQIVAVVPTHFHGDCLGGLSEFHKQNIMSYGNSLTIDLCIDEGKDFPKVGFDEHFELPVGNSNIELSYQGEGHTMDNIVCYIPDEKVLFGGCLIKCQGATKGYTGDANLDEWSTTVANVKNAFSEAIVIVPGHGPSGGPEILDYTIELFKK